MSEAGRMVSSRMQSLGCPAVPLGDGDGPLGREPGREQPQRSLHSTPTLTQRVSHLTALWPLQFKDYSLVTTAGPLLLKRMEMCSEKCVTLNIYTHYHLGGRPYSDGRGNGGTQELGDRGVTGCGGSKTPTKSLPPSF